MDFLRELGHRDRAVAMNAPEEDSITFEKYMIIWNDILTGLGLSPVGLHRTVRGEILPRVSIWRVVVIVLLLIVSIIIVIVQNSERKFDVFNLGSTIVSGYINLTGGLIMTFLTFSVMWNSRSYASLMSTFFRFNRCRLHSRSRAVAFDAMKFLSAYAVIIGVCFCMDCFVFLKNNDFMAFKYFLGYIPGLYGGFTVWHFAVCCFWLRDCLWNINRNVEKHSRSLASRVPLPLVEFLKINTVFPECLGTQPEMNANRLRVVRRWYHQVYVMSNRVNEVFGTRNLLTVAHYFSLGTILIYCGLNELLRYHVNSSTLTVLGIANYFKWSAVCFLYIYGIIWPCTKVYDEVQTTVMLIQQLFTKSSEGELQSELHSFVMQLFHEKIIFNPHGFFVLDNRLVLTIIGSVASYLIILIQFRITLI